MTASTKPYLCRLQASLVALGAVVFFFMGTIPAMAQVGHVLSGVGPVDQSWAGAGTANPQDALGALHWNPASITTLQTSSLNASLQLLVPTGTLSSTADPNAFGPGFPSARMTGSTSSEAGPFPIPALGFVYVPPASRWTVGVSAFGVGGFGVDYASQSGNPLTTPQPPGGYGMGPISSEFQLLQVSPTVAYRLTEHVSIGVAPTLNVSMLEVNPFPTAVPDDANGDGFMSYPGTDQESAFGYGFQVGVHLQNLNGFHLGASMKSTQQFDDFTFASKDEMGVNRTFSFNLDYPMILSFGVGYSGLDRFEFATDVRYIDFKNTEGFGTAGFDQTGAMTGFGWNSILVFAAGVQYDVSDRLPVRIGYSYNENPIEDDMSFFNCASPAIIQHRVSGGFSYAISSKVRGDFALQYGFKNAIEGHWMHPQVGAVPPTLVKSELSTFFAIFGIEVGL
ncbi:MAG TPA: outer membrane protein transport protein [Rhodothermales bacterium]|nr:outer membrane protein transport protein [Rhodothermales bacterium]